MEKSLPLEQVCNYFEQGNAVERYMFSKLSFYEEMIQEHACTTPISDNGTKPDCLIASPSWQVWFPGVSLEHSTGSRRCDETNSIPRIFC